jgi:hypothetical protein
MLEKQRLGDSAITLCHTIRHAPHNTSTIHTDMHEHTHTPTHKLTHRHTAHMDTCHTQTLAYHTRAHTHAHTRTPTHSTHIHRQARTCIFRLSVSCPTARNFCRHSTASSTAPSFWWAAARAAYADPCTVTSSRRPLAISSCVEVCACQGAGCKGSYQGFGKA